MTKLLSDTAVIRIDMWHRLEYEMENGSQLTLFSVETMALFQYSVGSASCPICILNGASVVGMNRVVGESLATNTACLKFKAGTVRKAYVRIILNSILKLLRTSHRRATSEEAPFLSTYLAVT